MNPFIKLTDNIDKSLPIIEQNTKDPVSTLHSELKQTVESRNLHIMLYGAYNAGKSTLVNTLLGRYEAKENDIPTTDSIDVYNWNGFKLLDTPGVNAPIAHENITQEQIKRSGAMLFVIREGDQDSKDIYERLFSMLKQNKKVFIVLNHQLVNPDDKIRALKKVNQIISSRAPEYNVSNETVGEISIFPMNIRTAYNGRVKKHEKLLMHSGYSDFINAFKQWLIMQDEKESHLENLKNQISECWYQPTISKLDKQVNASDSKELRALRDDRQMLEHEKRSIKASASHYISQQVNILKSDVSGVLSNSSSEEEIDSKLQQVFMPLTEKVEEWLGNELKGVSEKFTVSIDKHAKLNTESITSNSLGESVYSGVKEFLSDQKNLKEALLLGRKLKIPGLKGKWGSTFDKWAGRAAPAVQVVTFLYDLYKADNDQDKENSQHRQRSMELYQCVDQICSTVITDLTYSVHNMVDFTFDNQISEIQKQLDDDSRSLDKSKDSYNKLIQLREEMHTVSFQ